MSARMQFVIPGAAFWQKIPPPQSASYPGSSSRRVPVPLRRVNPSMTVSSDSPLVKVTTEPCWPPSMIVESGPWALRRVIALPRRSIVSK